MTISTFLISSKRLPGRKPPVAVTPHGCLHPEQRSRANISAAAGLLLLFAGQVPVLGGEGGHIVLVNGTDKDWELEKIHSYQMNRWDDNFPKKIKSGETVAVYVEWEKILLGEGSDSGAEAKYKVAGTNESLFEVQARDGSKIQVELIADTKFPPNDRRGNHTTVSLGWNHDGNMNFVMAGSAGSYMTSSLDTANWMRNQMDIIGSRRLIDICIPGTHDSGMSQSIPMCAGVPDRTVITHTKDIVGQLEAGARFFDIRPGVHASYPNGGKKETWRTWHGQEKNGAVLGAFGQEMDSIVRQVNAFTETHDELVILKLSSGLRADDSSKVRMKLDLPLIGGPAVELFLYKDLPNDDWIKLLKRLADPGTGLKRLITVDPDRDGDLTQMPLNRLLGKVDKEGRPRVGKQNVIVLVDKAVLDGAGDLRGQGFFSTSGWDEQAARWTTTSNFPIYDDYANKKNWDEMENDQFQKMRRHGSKYFLLSWTLTQNWDIGQILFNLVGTNDSILELADEANNELTEEVYREVAPGRFPNILYIDKLENSQAATLAAAINWKRSLRKGFISGDGNTLYAGERLFANQRLYSSNGMYYCVLQEKDGHFCINKAGEPGTDGTFKWGNEVHGYKGHERAYLEMQADGNLVAYDQNGAPKWSSATQQAYDQKYATEEWKPVKLRMDDDGSLRLYTKGERGVWDQNFKGVAR